MFMTPWHILFTCSYPNIIISIFNFFNFKNYGDILYIFGLRPKAGVHFRLTAHPHLGCSIFIGNNLYLRVHKICNWKSRFTYSDGSKHAFRKLSNNRIECRFLNLMQFSTPRSPQPQSERSAAPRAVQVPADCGGGAVSAPPSVLRPARRPCGIYSVRACTSPRPQPDNRSCCSPSLIFNVFPRAPIVFSPPCGAGSLCRRMRNAPAPGGALAWHFPGGTRVWRPSSLLVTVNWALLQTRGKGSACGITEGNPRTLA